MGRRPKQDGGAEQGILSSRLYKYRETPASAQNDRRYL